MSTGIAVERGVLLLGAGRMGWEAGSACEMAGEGFRRGKLACEGLRLAFSLASSEKRAASLLWTQCRRRQWILYMHGICQLALAHSNAQTVTLVKKLVSYHRPF